VIEKKNLDQWKRMLPMQKASFIDGASVFRNYEPAWRLLDDLSKGITDESFKEHTAPMRLISRDTLIHSLEDCLELGRSVGGNDWDMDRVKGMIEKVKLLDPEVLIDIEGIYSESKEWL
jgi:hypothetical protein